MYTVLAVDDEIWVLRGLQKIIDWNRLGFRFLGGMTDPAAAYERILEEPPDVVLVDIRMAGMSGLHMIAKLQEVDRDIIYVIVSAHAEFDYAKEAIRLGVVDYLVKPVARDELLALMEKLRCRLASRPRGRDGAWLYRHILAAGPGEVASATGMTAEAYFALAYAQDDPKADALREAVFLSAPHSEGVKTLFFLGEDGATEYALSGGPTGHVIRRIQAAEGFARRERMALGSSEVFQSEEETAARIRRAYNARLNVFVRPEAYYLSADARAISREAVDEMTELIRAGHTEAVLRRLDSLNETVRREQWQATDVYILMHAVLRGLWEVGGDSQDERPFEDIASVGQMVARFERLDNLLPVLKQCVERAMATRFSSQSGVSIPAVRDYIDRNYEADLSVRFLSELFCVDATYLGRVFRQKMGMGINEYITGRRVDRARSLLKNSDLTVAQVAQMCGYQDAFYFNKVFKKSTGLSPSRYKVNNQVK